LGIESVRTYNFRNLHNATITTDASEVFLVGENGQGKTNFLEAVYYACYASSFRTRRDETLRTAGTDEMAVEARVSDVGFDRSIFIRQSGRTKEIRLDGKPVDDRKELIATVPCIVFCHDDIAFVTGAPEMQRWFMNQTASLLEPGFVTDLRTYNRVLKARNAALKDRRTDLLDVLDTQLVQAGTPLVAARTRLTEQFSRTLATLFRTIFASDRELDLGYQTSWGNAADTNEETLHALLRESRDRDLDMRTSTRGPHRDRFPFRLNGRTLTDVASTGQLRLVSLLLRVTQAQLLAEVTRRAPVLLLDDVLLELDPDRRARFVDALPEYDQAFFTFLPDEQYARFRRDTTRTYRVEAGTLAES
jgi:DNA replication and repair protein RecF